MVKFAVYESWFDGEVIVPGKTLPERLSNLQAWGYEGVQIQRPSRELGVEALKGIFADSVVQLCIFGGAEGLLAADNDGRRLAVEKTKEGLYQAAELGALGSIVVPGRGRQPEISRPAPPKTLYDLEREIVIEELAEIAPAAEEAGVLLIIEPLNRYETHFIQRLAQGAEICRAVDSPNIRIMADFFHMNIEEGDMGQAIEDAGDAIGYVHLADSSRYEPGTGHLDFRPGLSALKRIGYDGFLTFECRIMAQDKGEALQESARYVRRLWEQI